LQEPGGYLAQIMSEDELKVFRRLLRKSKEIRNLMAHYNIRDGERLNDLENTKENLSDMLEFAIRGAALDRGVYQVYFYIYTYTDNLLIVYSRSLGLPIIISAKYLWKRRDHR
jgi:hypothetical protein